MLWHITAALCPISQPPPPPQPPYIGVACFQASQEIVLPCKAYFVMFACRQWCTQSAVTEAAAGLPAASHNSPPQGLTHSRCTAPSCCCCALHHAAPRPPSLQHRQVPRQRRQQCHTHHGTSAAQQVLSDDGSACHRQHATGTCQGSTHSAATYQA